MRRVPVVGRARCRMPLEVGSAGGVALLGRRWAGQEEDAPRTGGPAERQVER